MIKNCYHCAVTDQIKKLETRIKDLEARNKRVEADKAWETSLFRILTITAITYVIASFVLKLIGVEDFFLGALIPTIGYFLSVQSLPAIKRWWISRQK